MLRLPPFLCAVSCALSWSALVSAQTEGAPQTPPAEPPPAPTPEPPSADPTPPAPPSADPAPPSAPAPPASDAFPLPPASSPAPTASSPEPTAPSATPPKRAPGTAPPREEPPRRFAEPEAARPKPSEGLFQSPANVHHVEEREKDDGVDQFKIGPVVGVGVPSVISVGGTLKVTRFLGAGVNLGLIPKVKLSYYGDATLSYQHVDVYGRLYPFGGGFFLHGGVGYANVNGTLTGKESYSQAGGSGTAEYNGVGKVHTPTLTALIGYFYTTSVGFSIGVDAGAQIPIAPSTIEFNSTHSLSTNPPQLAPLLQSQADAYAAKADQSVRDTLEKIGRTTIPTVNLRIGWIL